jgi:hypothetical protein
MTTRIHQSCGVLALLAAAACTTNGYNSALPITSVVLGTEAAATDAGPSCTFTTSAVETDFPTFNPTDPTNLSGLVGFVVRNQLVSAAASNPVLRANTTDFTPHQAVVQYEIVGSTTTIPQQVIPVSSSSVSSGGVAPVVVPVFSPLVVRTALAALPAPAFVRTTTRIEGRLDDGSTARTSEHEYIIQVCNTCAETACF